MKAGGDPRAVGTSLLPPRAKNTQAFWRHVLGHAPLRPQQRDEGQQG